MGAHHALTTAEKRQHPITLPCACAYIHIHKHMHTYIRTYIHSYTHTHKHTYTHTYTCAAKRRTHAHICIHVPCIHDHGSARTGACCTGGGWLLSYRNDRQPHERRTLFRHHIDGRDTQSRSLGTVDRTKAQVHKPYIHLLSNLMATWLCTRTNEECDRKRDPDNRRLVFGRLTYTCTCLNCS